MVKIAKLIGASVLSAVMSVSAALAQPACEADPTTLQSRFQETFISRGDNFPKINVGDHDLRAVLVLLHCGWTPETIADGLGVPQEELEGRLAALRDEGLVHVDEAGRYELRVPVITQEDAVAYFQPDPEMVAETVSLIKTALPAVEAAYAEIKSFQGSEFAANSLLILSNVLLDSPQINTVEEVFLNAPRPQRDGGRYYFALTEKRHPDDFETFGIYGNDSRTYGAYSVNLYGNTRYLPPEKLSQLSGATLTGEFGFAPDTPVRQGRETLATDLVNRRKSPNYVIAPARASGLQAMGLLDDEGAVAIPVLTSEDYAALAAIADTFAPDLLSLLEAHRDRLETRFALTPYAASGVTFNEWFIWYYHFYYTAVTDQLIKDGVVTPPRGGVATYIITE